MWGVTNASKLIKPFGEFQLTRPMWGVTDPAGAKPLTVRISTHTPHVGRDFPRSPQR